MLADGHVVYQGVASESANYFDIKSKGTKNLNPCDFFMRELCVNYPKQQVDEDKIQYYLKRYSQEIEPVVAMENDQFTFGPLDLDQANKQTASFCN